MRNILIAVALIFATAFGVALSAAPAPADAAYSGSDHWHYWPGYASIGWKTDCGRYAPDLGFGTNGASCHYKVPVACVYNSSVGAYRLAQYIDVHWPNGDIAYNRGPAFSSTACTP